MGRRLTILERRGFQMRTRRTELVSQSEFARRQGVSKQMVTKYVGAGLPLHDGKIDVREARAWLRSNTTRGAAKGESFASARARKEASLADLRALELAVKKGE